MEIEKFSTSTSEDLYKLGFPAPYPLTTPTEMDSKKTFDYVTDSRYIKLEVRISDKVPNTDGTIEITTEDQSPIGKLEIQLKTLDKANINSPRYQCHKSFISYCRISTLAVILVVADNQNNCVYWLYMDDKTIADAKSRLKGETVNISIPIENKITKGSTDYISKWVEIVKFVKKKLDDHDSLFNVFQHNAAIVDLNEKFAALKDFIVDPSCGYIDQRNNAEIDDYIKKYEQHKNAFLGSEARFKLLIGDTHLIESIQVLNILAMLTWELKNKYLVRVQVINVGLEIFKEDYPNDTELMRRWIDIKNESTSLITQLYSDLREPTDIIEQKLIDFHADCHKILQNPNVAKGVNSYSFEKCIRT
jgi:hypothetical protein